MSKAKKRARPEAELEVLLSSALAIAFPHIPRTRFHHQTQFAVQLGHTEHVVDGGRSWKATGRADLILFHDDRALAVIELKRETLTLSDHDRLQGLSYAKMLTPLPPLVIITNGQEVKLFETATGEQWRPVGGDEDALVRLFQNAAKVASAGLEWAVEILLGPESGIWASAVRAETRHLINQLSGDAADVTKPFMRDLVFPRQATAEVFDAFSQGVAAVLIEGPPLIGKSHVLREMAEMTVDSDEFALFMVRGGEGVGLFQRIANVLSNSLEWPASADDIRQWLRRLSTARSGPALVLAINGLVAKTPMAIDIEELAEAGFGPKLQVVATVDDADSLLLSSNGRDETALATVTKRVEVQQLNIEEFKGAAQQLSKNHIDFTPGAHFSEEFRVPWLLRILVADIVSAPEYTDQKLGALLPATLGVMLFDYTQNRMSVYGPPQRGYRLLARDALADVAWRSPELALEVANAFIIRLDSLGSESREVQKTLLESGWITTYRHAGGEDILVPRAPELFASELAQAVSEELEKRCAKNTFDAGDWLANRMEGVFLGDLIGAQALRVLAERRSSLPLDLLSALIERRPSSLATPPGLYALHLEDGKLQNFRIDTDGSMRCADSAGHAYGEAIDISDDMPSMQKDMIGWMILSQFALLPTAISQDDGARIDHDILLNIGTCSFPLMRASKDPIGHLVHHIPGYGEILCADNGVIEPATAAMHRMFSNDWRYLDDWFDKALSLSSPALLNRILIALNQVCGSADAKKASWARGVLIERIKPAIEVLLAGNPSESM